MSADGKFIELAMLAEKIKLEIDALKIDTGSWDGRSLSIAITHLETAMLWLANARK